MTRKPKRFTQTCEITKKNKDDMEIECLVGATEGCFLKATCPKFKKYNQRYFTMLAKFLKNTRDLLWTLRLQAWRFTRYELLRRYFLDLFLTLLGTIVLRNLFERLFLNIYHHIAIVHKQTQTKLSRKLGNFLRKTYMLKLQ